MLLCNDIVHIAAGIQGMAIIGYHKYATEKRREEKTWLADGLMQINQSPIPSTTSNQ
jgi:hypothetical protein